MQYTLKTARKYLRESSNAYGQNDLRDSINLAIQNLSYMTGWERLRKILRFFSVGPHFVLPQGCAGIVRACVNGRPTTVRAQDFRFIHSGPGELNRPPSGFCFIRASNLVDVGFKPVMFEPRAPFRLIAFSRRAVPTTEEDPETHQPREVGRPTLHVAGTTPEGVVKRTVLVVNVSDNDYAAMDGTPAADETIFTTIVEVSLEYADDKADYISLWAEDTITLERTPIAIYNPYIEAPEFRHYEIAGIPPAAPIELLLECRLDPVPLVNDTDVLPFPSLNPIEWMIRGDWMMKAGETENAQKYYTMAANWMKALEVTEATAQTSVVVNSVFDNSMGEISMESVNI